MKQEIVEGEKGVVLVIALLLMLVLTLIGISSIGTSTLETAISGNERIWTDAFYVAEAGTQVAVNQLPDNANPVPKTEFDGDSYYWTEGAKSLGLHQRSGFDSAWSFKRYQVKGSGKSTELKKEIEVQVSYGPFSAGTQYHN